MGMLSDTFSYARNQLGPYPLSLMNHFLLAPQSSTPCSSRSPNPSSPTPDSPLTNIEDDDDEDSFRGHISPLHLAYDIREEDVIMINTLFDPEDPANKRPPFHDRDPSFILEWTRKERKKAENALVIENVDDLKNMVPFLNISKV